MLKFRVADLTTPLKGISHDAENVFIPILDVPQYYPDGDDITIAHLDIAKKPRFKMSVADAVEQGIIGEEGCNPAFTAVLPVLTMWWDGSLLPYYNRITTASLTPKGRKVWLEIFVEGFGHRIPPIRISPKARLHIIVN